MGPSLHSCVEVHEPIELSFGVVSGVGRGIDVWNGVQLAQGKGWFLGFLPNWLIGFNGIFFTEMYSTRA